jgi:hypothetical protein
MEDMKSILICDLFYQIAFDATRPLPKTLNRNKYMMVAIDHYYKCCETRLGRSHDVVTTTKLFLKKLPTTLVCSNMSSLIMVVNG